MSIANVMQDLGVLMGYARTPVNKTPIAPMVSFVDQRGHVRPILLVSTTLIVLALMVRFA